MGTARNYTCAGSETHRRPRRSREPGRIVTCIPRGRIERSFYILAEHLTHNQDAKRLVGLQDPGSQQLNRASRKPCPSGRRRETLSKLRLAMRPDASESEIAECWILCRRSAFGWEYEPVAYTHYVATKNMPTQDDAM